MDSIIEIWQPVIGFEAKYAISNLGHIKSFTSYSKGSILIPCMDARGYLNFSVRDCGKPKTLLIHREVAKAFIPNPHKYPLVRHLNDVKTENTVLNLAWGTYSDNRMDGIYNGKHFHVPGKRPAQAKLSKAEVLAVIESSHSNAELGRIYNVTESTICKIRIGRTWTKITGKPYIK